MVDFVQSDSHPEHLDAPPVLCLLAVHWSGHVSNASWSVAGGQPPFDALQPLHCRHSHATILTMDVTCQVPCNTA